MIVYIAIDNDTAFMKKALTTPIIPKRIGGIFMKKISNQGIEVRNIDTAGRKRTYTFKGGYHYLILGLALVSISAGLLLVTVSIAGIIKPLFLSGLGSMIGSAAIMLGGFVLYEEIVSSKDRGKLLHDALNRVIKDHN